VECQVSPSIQSEKERLEAVSNGCDKRPVPPQALGLIQIPVGVVRLYSGGAFTESGGAWGSYNLPDDVADMSDYGNEQANHYAHYNIVDRRMCITKTLQNTQ
jgi:hypothetical protein